MLCTQATRETRTAALCVCHILQAVNACLEQALRNVVHASVSMPCVTSVTLHAHHPLPPPCRPSRPPQEFAPGQMRGFWRVSYWDDDFRVMYTNKGNLFVIRKLGPEEAARAGA